MKSKTSAALAMIAALGISASARQAPAPAQRPTAAPAGNVENGRQLFLKYGCYECHGREGQGANTGPRLGPNPLQYAAFVRYVRAPKGEMPPYTDKLLNVEQDLADIHAFLSSRPAPPPASQLPPQ